MMKWFLDLTTRNKLFLGFGAMVAFLAIVIATAYSGISAIQASQKTLYQEDFANALDLVTLRSEQNRVRAALLTMFEVSTQSEREIWRQDVKDRSKLIAETLHRILVRNRNNTHLTAGPKEYQAIWAEFEKTRDAELIPLINEGKMEQAKALILGVQAERYRRMREITLEQSKTADEKARASVATSELKAEQAMQAFIFVGVVAVLLALTMALLMTRVIALPLRTLTAVAERITVGDLNVSVPADTRLDEVGTLARAFGRMIQSLRAMAGAAEQMAGGDLRSTIKPQSSEDVVGHAFARMAENLRGQIRDLIEGANVLGASASEIVASTAQLAASASESAAAVSETTTTVEEVRQTAQVASQKATQVSDSAQKSAQISQGGRARQGLRRGGAGGEKPGRAVTAGDRPGAHHPHRHSEGDVDRGDCCRA